MSVAVIVGISIMIVLLFLFWFNLKNSEEENKHFLLQLLILFFILVFLVLLSKATFDSKDYCSWNPTNSTTIGSTTTYELEYQCSTNTNNTANIFYKFTMWFVILVSTYIFFYFCYQVLLFFGVIIPK